MKTGDMKSMGTRSSKELRSFDLKKGCQGSIPCTGCQGDMPWWRHEDLRSENKMTHGSRTGREAGRCCKHRSASHTVLAHVMEILVCFHPNFNGVIATNFFTSYDSFVGVACAKYVAIWRLGTELSQNEIVIEFELWLKIACDMGVSSACWTQWGRNKMTAVLQTTFQINSHVWKSMYFDVFLWKPEGPINNIPVLVQIMTWRRSGDKLPSEPMMT